MNPRPPTLGLLIPPGRFVDEADLVGAVRTSSPGQSCRGSSSEQLQIEDIQCFLESNRIFKAMHSKLQPVLHDPTQVRAEVLNASADYRSALSRCVDALYAREESEDEPMAQDGDNEEDSGAKVAQLLLAIWHLCEIFLLDQRQVVTPGMLHWIQEHYSKFGAEDIAKQREELQNNPQPENDPSFWPTICELTALGLISEAQQILQLHSACTGEAWQDEVLEAIDVLLLRLPTLEDLATTSERLSEFSGRWQRWHIQAQTIFRELVDAHNPTEPQNQILELLGILAGEEEIFSKYASNWAQLLVAELLFKAPVMKRFDLKQRTEVLMRAHPSSPLFDEVILAIMGDDTGKAVKCCRELGTRLTALSTTAHLTELFVITGALESRTLPGHDVDMREQLFIELAAEVEKSGLGWELAVGYLDFCPVLGDELITNLLERTVLSSERELRNLVAYCNTRDLATLGRSLCSSFAMKRLASELYGAAAYWFTQACDEDRLVALCHKLVEKCMSAFNKESFGSQQLSKEQQTWLCQIDNVVEATGGTPEKYLVPELVFLHNYNTFLKSLSKCMQQLPMEDAISLQSQMMDRSEEQSSISEDVEVALKALCSMIQQTFISHRFLPHLMQLSMPLLKVIQSNSQMRVVPAQVYTLMSALHEIQVSPLNRIVTQNMQYMESQDVWTNLNTLLLKVLLKSTYSEQACQKPEEQMYSISLSRLDNGKRLQQDHCESEKINMAFRSADDMLAPSIPLLGS